MASRRLLCLSAGLEKYISFVEERLREPEEKSLNPGRGLNRLEHYLFLTVADGIWLASRQQLED